MGLRVLAEGKVVETPLSMDDILAAVEADDSIGFCIACGAETSGVEPDARKYKCDECGEEKVYGAEEILVMSTI